MTITKKIMLLILLSTGIAQAQTYDVYASGNVGMAMMQDMENRSDDFPGVTVDFGFDNGMVFAGALGLINGQFRSEIEYSHQSNDLDSLGLIGLQISPSDIGIVDGESTINAGLINAYYDFDIGSLFAPYISAGIGYASVKFDADVPFDEELSTADKDSTMAYQVGTGAGFTISDNVVLELRYRFLTGQSLRFENVESKMKTHNVSAGVRVKF